MGGREGSCCRHRKRRLRLRRCHRHRSAPPATVAPSPLAAIDTENTIQPLAFTGPTRLPLQRTRGEHSRCNFHHIWDLARSRAPPKIKIKTGKNATSRTPRSCGMSVEWGSWARELGNSDIPASIPASIPACQCAQTPSPATEIKERTSTRRDRVQTHRDYSYTTTCTTVALSQETSPTLLTTNCLVCLAGMCRRRQTRLACSSPSNSHYH